MSSFFKSFVWYTLELYQGNSSRTEIMCSPFVEDEPNTIIRTELSRKFRVGTGRRVTAAIILGCQYYHTPSTRMCHV